MDRTADYLNIIKKLLETYAQSPPSCGQIEMETVFDDTRRHYQLMALGWQGKRRVHGCLIHIDLRGEKYGCSMTAQMRKSPKHWWIWEYLPIISYSDFIRSLSVATAVLR